MTKAHLNAIGFIFARGGSKGVPGKNVKLLGGIPLIAHAIRVAQATPEIESIIVSTDDQEIADVARAYGAEAPFMRPAELAQDSSPEWLAWRHAIEWVREHRGDFDLFVSLPTTAPFRAVCDVQACIAAVANDPSADVAITVAESARSPYFNMVTVGGDSAANLVISPDGEVCRRQDAPKVFDITTVAYAARPEFVLQADRIFAGKVKAVVVPQERALDIDTPFDFQVAEAIVATSAEQSPSSNHTENR